MFPAQPHDSDDGGASSARWWPFLEALEGARFTVARRGYHQDEVDALLERLQAAAAWSAATRADRSRDPSDLAWSSFWDATDAGVRSSDSAVELIDSARFRVRRRGYAMAEVDDLLLDLRGHAERALGRPAIEVALPGEVGDPAPPLRSSPDAPVGGPALAGDREADAARARASAIVVDAELAAEHLVIEAEDRARQRADALLDDARRQVAAVDRARADLIDGLRLVRAQIDAVLRTAADGVADAVATDAAPVAPARPDRPQPANLDEELERLRSDVVVGRVRSPARDQRR